MLSSNDFKIGATGNGTSGNSTSGVCTSGDGGFRTGSVVSWDTTTEMTIKEINTMKIFILINCVHRSHKESGFVEFKKTIMKSAPSFTFILLQDRKKN